MPLKMMRICQRKRLLEEISYLTFNRIESLLFSTSSVTDRRKLKHSSLIPQSNVKANSQKIKF